MAHSKLPQRQKLLADRGPRRGCWEGGELVADGEALPWGKVNNSQVPSPLDLASPPPQEASGPYKEVRVSVVCSNSALSLWGPFPRQRQAEI